MEFEKAREILNSADLRIVEDLDISQEALKGKPTRPVSKPSVEENSSSMSLHEFSEMFEWYANTSRGKEFLQKFILNNIRVDGARPYSSEGRTCSYVLRTK